jgi:hypothetical protein
MSILAPLGRAFTRKPLVVGGRAMEHYGLRPSGPDIDLVLAFDDFVAVVHEHPGRLKDLWGDLGVCVGQYELWKTICLLSYADLVDGAVDLGDVLVISLEKLLLMKALAMTKEKYLADTRLVAARLLQDQARGYARVGAENAELLRDIPGVAYVEHRGPGASSPSNVIATSHGIPRRNVARSRRTCPPSARCSSSSTSTTRRSYRRCGACPTLPSQTTRITSRLSRTSDASSPWPTTQARSSASSTRRTTSPSTRPTPTGPGVA